MISARWCVATAVGLTFLIPFPHVQAQASRRIDTILQWSDVSAPGLRLARDRRDQMRAQLWTQRTALLPRVDLRLSRTWSSPADQDGWQVQGQWSLFSRGLYLQAERARLEAEAAEIEFASSRARVEGDLLRNLGLWLLVQYRDVSLGLSLRVAKETQTEVEIRLRSGSRTRLDLLKTQSQVASLRAQQATLEVDRISATDGIARVLGISRELTEMRLIELFRLPDELKTREAVLSAEIEALVPRAPEWVEQVQTSGELASWVRNNALAVERARLRRELETAAASGLAASEWPDLSLRASTGQQAAAGQLQFSSEGRTSSASIVLNIPLFSFGSSFSSFQAARAGRAQAETQYIKEVDEAIGTVAALLARQRALRAQNESLQVALSRQVEIETLTTKSFQLGRATSIEVQIAQNDVLQGRLSLAQGTYELALATQDLILQQPSLAMRSKGE